ncbi:RNA polymerase sigma-70 factor (ECF subfamily) [Arthrobacter globiformis]|uniref:RNA polymerase sigma factor n=1 Tax=Arthrobacter globiformis TaxID=1665 RepID=UPI0027862BFB|nr:sigma-70 family RNA polymerase sigma factor [Arthrobacter globiformis]MDQ1058263.1 RNA polymerase sigma-70 factor (ECF subfamily) [Arthrobacter globiformis]
MGTPQTREKREGRFAALYTDAYTDVLRFVQRRAGPHRAEDVVHKAFLVAWRRFDDVPAGRDDARAWLFGTARHCLLNDQRSQFRQGALEVRIAEVTKGITESEDDLVAFHVDLSRAWQQLRPEDQEVLSLAIWENLSSPQAGRVLGITAATYRIRLYRARLVLRRILKHTTSTAFDPDYSVTEQLT